MAERVVGSLPQIPKGEGRNFAIGDQRIAIFHTHRGEVFATQADCPHRDGPLADGLIDSETVICPLHERSFNLRTGRDSAGECRIAVFPVRVAKNGAIWVGTTPLPA